MRRRNFIRSIMAFPFFKNEAINILSKIKFKREIDYRKIGYQSLLKEIISIQPLNLPC